MSIRFEYIKRKTLKSNENAISHSSKLRNPDRVIKQESELLKQVAYKSNNVKAFQKIN